MSFDSMDDFLDKVAKQARVASKHFFESRKDERSTKVFNVEKQQKPSYAKVASSPPSGRKFENEKKSFIRSERSPHQGRTFVPRSRNGSRNSDCSSNTSTHSNSNKRNFKCYNCDKVGHISRDCRAPRKQFRSNGSQNNIHKFMEEQRSFNQKMLEFMTNSNATNTSSDSKN
ncbi:hypothetical protein B4U80_14720 [Leptotrombidium deliense]|uniref:CCHC-type domain-containing protein n=1 Tax=Leptotrombidium deliense TaxID=299467 RepID=A0A443R3Q2_9ACAR|nr:hypothetical protein B4U80_14720 [Leptotrombidium deliense]